MSKFSWVLVLGCLGGVVFPRPGGAQILNPYSPNNMWQQNINLSITHQLQKNALKRRLNAARAERGEKPLDFDEAKQAEVGEEKEVAYVKARHQFKPSKKSTMVNEFVKAMNVEAEKETEVKAALNLAMRMMKAEAKKQSRQNNISFAVAVLLGSAYSVFYAEEFDDTKLEAVSKSLDEIFGRIPKLDEMKNADKQKLVEGFFLSAAWVMGVYQNAVETQDIKTIEDTKLAMRQLIQPLGIDDKNLKSLLEKMAE